MKLVKSIILCGLTVAVGTLTSCNDWLDVNVDPDSPSAESAEYQQRLAHIEFYTNHAYGFAGWRNAFAAGDWTRYSGGGTYQNMSFWYPTASITTTPYQWWFVGAMANVQDMYDKAMADGNTTYAGVAKVLRSYGMMLMTDLYGEMPYTEACSNDTAIPKYDNGKTIYLGCLKELDEGIELLEQYASVPADRPSLSEGDYYANGDVQKWIKFAYLLKARWCLKLSKKQSGSYLDGKYDATTILAALDKAMQSNSDNMIINHTDDNSTTHDVLGWDEPIDYSPLFSVSGMNAGYYVTKVLFDNLTNFDGKGIEDPRADHIIPWQYSIKTATSPTEVAGNTIKWKLDDASAETGYGWRRSIGVDMLSDINSNSGPIRSNFGVNSGKGGNYWWIDSENTNRLGDTVYVEQTSRSKGYNANVDLLYRRGGTDLSRESGTFFTRVSSPGYVGTYAECCFIKAEVLYRQGNVSGAKEAYKKGVKASIELMNEKLKSWVAGDNTLASCPSFTAMSDTAADDYVNSGALDGELTLGKILTQKRLALGFHMEIWNDMRRTDYGKPEFGGKDEDKILGWDVPAYHALNTSALNAIPAGKSFRRWQQCSHERNYNADNLQAIGAEVPGADMTSTAWNSELDVWTINVWWDSTQE